MGGGLFKFKDMGHQAICVEIDGVFYESLACAKRKIGHHLDMIKRRCLSDKFPNYKIVPFRVTYTEKQCLKCGNIKLLKEFNNDTKTKDKLKAECRECNSSRGKKHYQNNEEKIKKQTKEWRNKNPETKNKIAREWVSKKRGEDLMFRLNEIMSCAIRRSLKGMKNGAPLETLVDYDCEKLIKHFESLFTEGMSWDNYGSGKYEWSIDHIIAKSKFNITSVECQEFKDCWSLDNLQPLWHTRNMEKGDRPMHPKYLIKPF